MKKLMIEEMNRLSVEDFRQAKKIPLVVILDNVRSQHNIGAVFRTADAFLLESIELCGICCCPPNQEIHKTALGAEESVVWHYHEDTADAIEQLHQQGYVVWAIEQAHNSISPEQALKRIKSMRQDKNEHAKGIAVVLGHEVFGVHQSVIDHCDACIEIPQYGTKHSLNVSVTAGIIIYCLSSALR